MRISDWSSDVCSSDLLAVVIDNSVLSYPGIDPFRRVADAYPQAASVVINPKTIVVQMLAGNRRDLNQATNQTTRRAPTAIAHAHRSEARRVGKECVSTFRSRWPQFH